MSVDIDVRNAFRSGGPAAIPPLRQPQGIAEPAEVTGLKLDEVERRRREDSLRLEGAFDVVQQAFDKTSDRIEIGTWTPRIYVGGIEFTGAYLAGQDVGWWRRVDDTVAVRGWIRTSANVNPVNQTIAIGRLPFETEMRADSLMLELAVVVQASMLAGGVFGRLQPSTLKRIVINDSATQLGATGWSFNAPVYMSFGAEYRIQRS